MAAGEVATGAALVSAILGRGLMSLVAASTISAERRDLRTDVGRSGVENSGLNGLSREDSKGPREDLPSRLRSNIDLKSLGNMDRDRR